MKKIIPVLVSVGLLFVPLIALAQWGESGIEAPGWGDVEVMDTLDSIVNWLFAILMVVAAIAIVIAAYFFVTAAGDPEKTKTARNFVLYALVGVLVAFLARALIYLIDYIVRG